MAGAYRALAEEVQQLVEQAKQDAEFREVYASGFGCGKTIAGHERFRQIVYQRTGVELPSLEEAVPTELYDERETHP